MGGTSKKRLFSDVRVIFSITGMLGLTLVATVGTPKIESICRESQPYYVNKLYGGGNNKIFVSDKHVVYYMPEKLNKTDNQTYGDKYVKDLSKVKIVNDGKNTVEYYKADITYKSFIFKREKKRDEVYVIHTNNKPKKLNDIDIQLLNSEGKLITDVVKEGEKKEKLRVPVEFRGMK